MRINRACELLASTDYYVIDVAFEVGYNNIKTFNINFFKYKGMTPSDFRNRITLQKPDRQRGPAKPRKEPPERPTKRNRPLLFRHGYNNIQFFWLLLCMDIPDYL